MRPYGLEARLNRFMDDKNIFSGLIMFFDPADDEFKRVFMSTAPKDQPLLYAILFHEYKDSILNCKKVLQLTTKRIDEIEKMERQAAAGTKNSVELIDKSEFVSLIFALVKRDPIRVLEIVKEKILPNSGDTLAKLRASFKSWINKREDNEFSKKLGMPEDSKAELDFTNDSQFRQFYTKYFGDQKQRTYESVREEYAVDLEILQQFLLSASIPAITIEKPFIAKEVKSIDGIIAFVDSPEFSAFISNNFELLQKETMDEFARKQRERMVNQSVMREIEEVLNSMSDVADVTA